ncbi:unnamed protein product [Phytophthora lilii]|uniref:Unnamed protein product n=1 Tax=Phytophthora lilii TaxID=2077276 RepID=A0A9W6X2L7_9STRA|nr:unnamed protein product [Phytophthora lilii]
MVDLVWLVKWFTRFSEGVGEVVPVRVRMQKNKDGVVKKYYSREDYTLLPATSAWDSLYDEMHNYVSFGLRVHEPARSTFRKLLSIHCPTIKIRSSQKNMCDIFSIYQTRMSRGGTAEQFEELKQHTESARRMRREYNKDKAAFQAADGGGNDTAVLVMDFSQNPTIPSVTSTPSQCGKGSDQTNSMLQHFIDAVLLPAGKKKHLVVYADNCSGQNKNNFVIKFFLAQVQMGMFERIDYKFFLKGHTKSSCDRGFGHIRKHVGRSDCWTMDQFVDTVKASATSNTTVRISRGDSLFKNYKPMMSELYKTLLGVQQYQIFTWSNASPVLTEGSKVSRMMEHFVEDLSSPPPNAEKMTDLNNKIRPYVPKEHQDDQAYAPPSKEQGKDAKAAKQARREHRAALAIAAKKNSEQRGRDANPAPKKRKPNISQTAVV